MSVTATADDIVLTQPMAVLRQFSEVELDRLATIARRDKELLQQTMTNALARAERALNEERRRAEEAEAKNARLREKLRSLGVDSDG
jgi:DNA-binding protein YbaB